MRYAELRRLAETNDISNKPAVKKAVYTAASVEWGWAGAEWQLSMGRN